MKPAGFRPKIEHITVVDLRSDGALVKYAAKGERRSEHFYAQRREARQ